MKMFCPVLKSVLLLVCFLSMVTAAAAGPQALDGVVRNQTTARPSVGDDVILLRLVQGLQQEARTKTDTQGRFSLHVTLGNAHLIVRVRHQGVNYDQAVTGSATLDISVFDAVNKAPGLTGNMGMAQMESDGKVLKVTEMYALTNASSPPVTQSGSDSFRISVPENGALQWAELKGPGNLWLNVTSALVKTRANEYAINFPLRPGDTLFKFMFSVPDLGVATFQLKLAYPVKKFAVMHPASMSFKPSTPGTFSSPGQTSGLQVEAVTKSPTAEVPSFEISGMGSAPPLASAAISQPSLSVPPLAAARNTKPAISAESSAAPVHSNRKIWLAFSAIIFILGVGIFAVLRMKQNAVSVAARSRPENQESLLVALRGELSRLERARVHGSISTEEYVGTRKALNQSIQIAMAKGQN
jgi:hypothetical protein